MYLHDSAAMFRFVLKGELSGLRAQDLEQAWTTAQSTLNGRELVVDVSGLTGADESGVGLLARMRSEGARLTAALPPKSEEFLRSLGLSVAAPRGQCARTKVLRFLRCAGSRMLPGQSVERIL
jgi:anti-anti-sigma regulatory factor